MTDEGANLSPHDQATYSKLFVSARDIGIAGECAAYLIKKRWHTHSFFRRGSIRIQQTAMTSTMIVSYGRPFAHARGYYDFPAKLLKFDTEEQTQLHKRMMILRNEQYAHSNPDLWEVRPLNKTYAVAEIFRMPEALFSPDDLTLLLSMTRALSKRIDERLKTLRANAPN